MKKIIFRKLLLDYLRFFLIALISTSVVIWVFQAVNFLDIMIEDGRDYLVYINYSLLNFPKILTKLIPFVFFFSLFYVTIKYESDNELILFWNFGVNKIEVVNFILKFSLILLLIQLLLSSVIVPKSQNQARSFLRTSNVNFFGNFIKPQKFNDTIKGVTIYSESKDDKNLFNLYIKKEIGDDDFQITYARKGTFKDNNGVPILVLFDGETIRENKDEITKFSFSKSDFSLKNLKTNTITYKKTQEISTKNLLICILGIYKFEINNNIVDTKKIQNCLPQNLSNIFKEIYKRLVLPLYLPILSIIPFILLISSKENVSYSKFRFLTFVIGLSVIILSETTIRLISKFFVNNITISVIPIIILAIMYIIFIIKFRSIKRK
ncbi:LptF/LptG family permease [Candidatus Pelagibacter sp.]|nr:LptF/LptG family permease [Candidatus Pelagibacter sp.]